MKSISKMLVVIIVLLSVATSFAQNQNEQQRNNGEMVQAENVPSQNVSQLHAIFDKYFSVKDALVKTDANTASSSASELAAAIKAVDMSELSFKEHTVWMKVMKELSLNTASISKSKDVVKQRESFALLSRNVYELAKVSTQGTPIYYQHCPMYNNGKGANWLSKNSEIKNPYYGNTMLTCGNSSAVLK